MDKNRRKTFADLDHDQELLLETVAGRSYSRQLGPFAEFLAKKEAEQEPKTVAGYQSTLYRFHEFLGQDATVADITEVAGHRFLKALRDSGLSENSVATHFRNLKAFTVWMHKKGWTERDRFEDVKRPAFVRPKFDTLTDEQKQLILGSFDPKTFLGARNLTVVCIFLDTGVRLEELVHLEEKGVHLDRAYIEVYSRKTDDWRVIPLSRETIGVCRHYLEVRARYLQLPVRHRAAPGDVNHRVTGRRRLNTLTFFCSWKGEALTENGVGLMIRHLRKRLADAGTPIHIHPHLFRHNFLTEKALDGENPSLVRRWAGHRSYEMTDYYFGLAEAKLAAIQPKRSTLGGMAVLPSKRGRPRGSKNRQSGHGSPPRITES
ncbi:MAG: tyrosine-type recombinase/integrase [Chloroflexota bacterium]|nr:tyrosine-type recombinase/integrase [Chloroflexota bacterium]